IPTSRRGIENSLDCCCIARVLEPRCGSHLTGASACEEHRGNERKSLHHLYSVSSGTSRSPVPHGSVSSHPFPSCFTGCPAAFTLSAASSASPRVGTMISHSSRRASASLAGGAPRAHVFVPR